MVSRILGIIGGGQLGMMLTEAARDIPSIDKVVVLDPTPQCPASQAGAVQIQGNFGDPDAIRELAKEADIITYEIESGDSDTLKEVEGMVEINPSPETLHTIQDKFRQKSFLFTHGLPVPPFMPVSSLNDIERGIEWFDLPMMLKARTGGYDGRGNYTIQYASQIEEACKALEGAPLMLEKFMPYRMEISVIVARNTAGQTASYPPVENMHHSSILRQTISPARIDEEISREARRIATKTMRLLQGAGVFGIEMFLLHDDTLMINEIAPRVHNSGHHTLQSCTTSQFRQHLLAILGMELEDTTPKSAAVMYNILGPEGYTGQYGQPRISHPQVTLKMYGKHTSKPLRKLGHLNITGQSVQDALAVLESIKADAAITTYDT